MMIIKNIMTPKIFLQLKGIKVHKLKSLEENKIKNNDVIILNTFDI